MTDRSSARRAITRPGPSSTRALLDGFGQPSLTADDLLAAILIPGERPRSLAALREAYAPGPRPG